MPGVAAAGKWTTLVLVGAIVTRLSWGKKHHQHQHHYQGKVMRESEASKLSAPRLWLNLGEPWAFEAAVVTTCGGGGAADNNGWWKPKRLLDGAASMAKSVRATGSELPVLVVTFTSEPEARERCESSQRLRKARVICHELDDSVKPARGYGYAKVAAVVGAPVRIVVWIDADAWFVNRPDWIVARAHHGKSGALFWPDYYNEFKPDRSLWQRVGPDSAVLCASPRLYYDCVRCHSASSQGTRCASDPSLHKACACAPGFRPRPDDVPADAVDWPRATNGSSPRDWSAAQGFDSGLLAVDKARTQRQLARLERLAHAYGDDARWAAYSHGDKDLWHIAWMLDRAPYTLSPFAAHVAGSKKNNDTHLTHTGALQLISQAKLDRKGRVLALHQNWREVRRDDLTALVVADLRLVQDPPWRPRVADGFTLPPDADVKHLPPHLRQFTVSPAPSSLLRSLASVRADWRLRPK